MQTRLPHARVGRDATALNVAPGYACLHECHVGHSCSNDGAECTEDLIDLTLMEDGKCDSDNQCWRKCGDIRLSNYHQKIIASGAWLDDLIICAAQTLLQHQHPHIDGFQNTVLADKLAMIPPTPEFIQVVNICGDHWITFSSIGCTDSSSIKVYDSPGGRLSKSKKKLAADLLQSKSKTIMVYYENVQKQLGGIDCGCFALAYAASLCSGIEPSTELYDQEAMRIHQ